MKFSIKIVFNRPNAQETADLVIFAEEILNGKLHFCAVGEHEHALKLTSDSMMKM